MGVCFDGYDEKILTFEKSGTVTEGYPVKISENGKVSNCSKDDKFCGFAVSVRDNIVAVQMGGYREATCSSATGHTLALGYNNVTANTGGNIITAESGNSILVLSKDDTKIGFIF